MILFFDVETSGFPVPSLPPEHADQPHLVQLACLLTEEDGRERASVSLIVNPGVPIPARATATHGITDEQAILCGVLPYTAAIVLAGLLDRADLIVAHNMEFDAALARIAFARHGIVVGRQPRRFCTMKGATPVLNLPPTERMIAAGFTKPKAPKLEECIRHFFDEPLDGAHDAMVDVRACARVFFALRAAGAGP